MKLHSRFASASLLCVGWLSMSIVQAQNGAMTQMKKPLPPFSRVVFSLSGDLEINPSEKWNGKIEAEKSVVDAIRMAVQGDTLKIESVRSYRTQRPLKVTVQVPVLTSLTTDASGEIVVGAVSCKSLSISASGSGGIKANNLNCTDVEIDLSGSGDVLIAGKTQRLSVKSSGSGSLDAQAMPAAEVRVKQDGSGDVIVNASHTLTGAIDGAGDLKYVGAAKPKVSVNGAGELVKVK